MNLTILHVNTERRLRGGEFQMLMLAQEMQKRGHKNKLLVQRGSEVAGEASARGLDTSSFAMRGEWDLLAAVRLRKAIRRYQPQIIHAHTSHAGTLALIARGNRRSPVIVLSRRIALPLKRNPLTIYKYRSVDAVLAVSNWIKSRLIRNGLREDRIFVAESGTDFSRFQKKSTREEMRNALNIDSGAFVIGNVGNIEPQKGQLFLLQAFSQLLRKNASASYHLILAGSGRGLEECRSFAHRLNISDHVLFAGFRSDIEDYYAVMDVFFLSTIPAMGEGWSGAVREAMATGVPVIAVRQESIAEQIQDGVTGLLVDFENLREWSDAIERVQRDRDLRLALTEKARSYIEQFTVQRMADRTEECYGAVLTRSTI